MQNWLESRAQISADRPALRVDGQVLSYGELAQQTQNTAAALSEAGIQPGGGRERHV